eukprot:2398199-Rhodomonas_salina.1
MVSMSGSPSAASAWYRHTRAQYWTRVPPYPRSYRPQRSTIPVHSTGHPAAGYAWSVPGAA